MEADQEETRRMLDCSWLGSSKTMREPRLDSENNRRRPDRPARCARVRWELSQARNYEEDKASEFRDLQNITKKTTRNAGAKVGPVTPHRR